MTTIPVMAKDATGQPWVHHAEFTADARQGWFVGDAYRLGEQPRVRRCGACQPAENVVVWLGIRWIGQPWPRRLPHPRRRYDGCGCILKLKVAVTLLASTMKRIRMA